MVSKLRNIRKQAQRHSAAVQSVLGSQARTHYRYWVMELRRAAAAGEIEGVQVTLFDHFVCVFQSKILRAMHE